MSRPNKNLPLRQPMADSLQINESMFLPSTLYTDSNVSKFMRTAPLQRINCSYIHRKNGKLQICQDSPLIEALRNQSTLMDSESQKTKIIVQQLKQSFNKIYSQNEALNQKIRIMQQMAKRISEETENLNQQFNGITLELENIQQQQQQQEKEQQKQKTEEQKQEFFIQMTKSIIITGKQLSQMFSKKQYPIQTKQLLQFQQFQYQLKLESRQLKQQKQQSKQQSKQKLTQKIAKIDLLLYSKVLSQLLPYPFLQLDHSEQLTKKIVSLHNNSLSTISLIYLRTSKHKYGQFEWLIGRPHLLFVVNTTVEENNQDDSGIMEMIDKNVERCSIGGYIQSVFKEQINDGNAFLFKSTAQGMHLMGGKEHQFAAGYDKYRMVAFGMDLLIAREPLQEEGYSEWPTAYPHISPLLNQDQQQEQYAEEWDAEEEQTTPSPPTTPPQNHNTKWFCGANQFRITAIGVYQFIF